MLIPNLSYVGQVRLNSRRSRREVAERRRLKPMPVFSRHLKFLGKHLARIRPPRPTFPIAINFHVWFVRLRISHWKRRRARNTERFVTPLSEVDGSLSRRRQLWRGSSRLHAPVSHSNLTQHRAGGRLKRAGPLVQGCYEDGREYRAMLEARPSRDPAFKADLSEPAILRARLARSKANHR